MYEDQRGYGGSSRDGWEERAAEEVRSGMRETLLLEFFLHLFFGPGLLVATRARKGVQHIGNSVTVYREKGIPRTYPRLVCVAFFIYICDLYRHSTAPFR